MRSVIDLGHSLGITRVSEGVETEQILAALAGAGCDVAQGRQLSRPITAAALDTWCAGRHIEPMRSPAICSQMLANSPASGDILTSAATKVNDNQ